MNGSVTYEGLILQGGINVDVNANLEELTAYENGVYNPSEGKDGFSKVTVDVPAAVLDDITITENGHYTPPIGVDGYNDIVVTVPHPAPVLDDITITENGSYQPPSGVDGYDNITVNVPLPSNGIYKQTLSGLPSPIATFTGADAPIDSLKASIVGVQSGSGDPSPSNVRPITGWTGCEVTDNNDTYTIPFKDSSDNPITVYDGGIDVTGGSWLSNRLFEVFDNTAIVTFGRNGYTNWYYQIVGTNTGTSGETAETISNMYSYANIGNDNDNLGIMKLSNGNFRVRVGGTQPATVDDFVNSLGVTPLQVVSKLATPQTGTFTPVNIRSNGLTNISVDCGEVTELKYYSDLP